MSDYRHVTGLRRSALFAFGRAVLSFLWCSAFPRCEGKNRTQKRDKYYATEHPELACPELVEGPKGRQNQALRGPRRKSCDLTIGKETFLMRNPAHPQSPAPE